MQVEKHKHNRQINAAEANFEAADAISCTEVKAKLDELSSGRFALEKMDKLTKTFLFRHLENCTGCCRAFDVRMRFRPTRHATIY